MNKPGDKVKVTKDLSVTSNPAVTIRKSGPAVNTTLPKGTKGEVEENLFGSMAVKMAGDYDDLVLVIENGMYHAHFAADGGPTPSKTKIEAKKDIKLKSERGITATSKKDVPEVIPKGTKGTVSSADGKNVVALVTIGKGQNATKVTLKMGARIALKYFDIT